MVLFVSQFRTLSFTARVFLMHDISNHQIFMSIDRWFMLVAWRMVIYYVCFTLPSVMFHRIDFYYLTTAIAEYFTNDSKKG